MDLPLSIAIDFLPDGVRELFRIPTSWQAIRKVARPGKPHGHDRHHDEHQPYPESHTRHSHDLAQESGEALTILK